MMISPPEALLATGLCYLERPREGHAILETLESINDNTMVNKPSHLAQIYEAKAICSYREGFPERALEQINLSLQVMTYPGRAAERSERKHLKAKILAELGQTAAAVHELQKAELLFMDIEMADHPLSLKTKNTIPALN